MSDALIYHGLREALLKCRREVLLNEINAVQADAAFDTACETLMREHCQTRVLRIYQQFEADLKLMSRLEWLEQEKHYGRTIALIIMYFTDNDTLDRVSRTWQALVSLDEELSECVPEQVDV